MISLLELISQSKTNFPLLLLLAAVVLSHAITGTEESFAQWKSLYCLLPGSQQVAVSVDFQPHHHHYDHQTQNVTITGAGLFKQIGNS
jgi:hypothetical protein